MPALNDPELAHSALCGADLLHNPYRNKGIAFSPADRHAPRIATYTFDHDLAGIPRPDDIDAHIRTTAYKPVYPDTV